MGHQVTLGGERLGGGKKNKVSVSGFERTTVDLSFIWRSSMSAGTLVPFMKTVALPGDTMDINLDVDVMTLPTIGPLFGSFKVHLDVFFAPIRLYHASLMQNRIGIGMNMSQVILPTMVVEGNVPVYTRPIDNQHVNPSCILKYLGISGVGYQGTMPNQRKFQAVPYLAYWEIYKQYYANKQEANGAMIHVNPQPTTLTMTSVAFRFSSPDPQVVPIAPAAASYTTVNLREGSQLNITFSGAIPSDFQISNLELLIQDGGIQGKVLRVDQLFSNFQIDGVTNSIICSTPNLLLWPTVIVGQIRFSLSYNLYNTSPTIYRFPLANIDAMKTSILQYPAGTDFQISTAWPANAPYSGPFQKFQTAVGPPVINNYSMMFGQEGLGLRTYASDLYNNWLDTAIIDGGTGITAVTSVNVVANKFTIDELNLSKKVYEMLNRIAISGGTYDDWLDAVYSHERTRPLQTPIYLGGALRNLVFQEVVGLAATPNEPLGSLAGRGRLGSVNKGGRITVKVDEPGYVIGIASLVPNLDYCQGNDWDGNLKTLNDFHKPGLDEIGFQNLITDQMAWYDTLSFNVNTPTFRAAGKQPAWIQYMTEVNKVFGNFADENQQQFMVLARRYNMNVVAGQPRIEDLTTYIDPSKFNHIFADARLDAQNFWVQIAVKNTARRKMSGKVIPNL